MNRRLKALIATVIVAAPLGAVTSLPAPIALAGCVAPAGTQYWSTVGSPVWGEERNENNTVDGLTCTTQNDFYQGRVYDRLTDGSPVWIQFTSGPNSPKANNTTGVPYNRGANTLTYRICKNGWCGSWGLSTDF